jgi:hypothetical protein
MVDPGHFVSDLRCQVAKSQARWEALQVVLATAPGSSLLIIVEIQLASDTALFDDPVPSRVEM